MAIGMLIGDPVDDRFTVFETKDGGITLAQGSESVIAFARYVTGSFRSQQ